MVLPILRGLCVCTSIISIFLCGKFKKIPICQKEQFFILYTYIFWCSFNLPGKTLRKRKSEKVHVTVTLTAVSVGFHIPTCQRKKIGLQRQTINSRKTERYSTESILKAFIDRWNRKTERLKLQCMQITKQNHRRDQSLYPHKTFQVNQWKVGCLLNHTTALKYKERERERETERESWSFWIMCLLVNKRQFEFYLKCVS
jgi:hypothetical protein